MPKAKKPKVEVSAGALVVVEINGVEKRFNCTGATRGSETPEKVIKKIQDCIRASVTKASKAK